jgi:signal transduction histidine kinase
MAWAAYLIEGQSIMLNKLPTESPTGLNADQDAAALLRKLGIAVLCSAVALGVILYLRGDGLRPSVIVSTFVGSAMLLLLRAGHLIAAARVLCWGLLLAGGTAIYMFGIRSTGGLLMPLAIMSGGWLLGRWSAVALAVAGSSVSFSTYLQHVSDPTRALPPITLADGLGHIVIFSVTAILAVAMSATLKRQYDKVNALAKGLQQANATLEQRVAERSTQLAVMQQKVMDTEKLTSLGAMVAGISHELNTPLGNALTVSTALEAQVHTLSRKVEDGQLTRSDLSEFLAGAAAMSALNTQSVTRAAALVASFKQIAVDQTSEQRRSFRLHQVVADNVAALRPSIRNAGIVIDVNIPADIVCDSYPGPLGQVLTNLLQNAVLHGFDGEEQGRVEVSATVKGETVYLSVSDNGRGMEPLVQARVFEPFFTTRLGKGGSGLGLSVSHRIASSVLAGDLTVQSQAGQGSTFTLAFSKQLRGPL